MALVFSDNGRAGGSVLEVEPDDRIVIQTGVIKWRLRRAGPEDDVFMLTTDLAREAWIVVEQVAADTATRSS